MTDLRDEIAEAWHRLDCGCTNRSDMHRWPSVRRANALLPIVQREVDAARAEAERLTNERDEYDRKAVQAVLAADRWRAEYERVRSEHEAAVIEIKRLRDNPVARRMKAERDAARANVAEAIANSLSDRAARASRRSGGESQDREHHLNGRLSAFQDAADIARQHAKKVGSDDMAH